MPAVDQVRLGRRNLFILPSREGTLFLGLLGIMLLTAINYQNSLIYLLTFLLGALFYVGMLQTHENLSRVELSLAGLDEGFAGAVLRVVLRVQAQESRPAVVLSTAGAGVLVNLQGNVSEEVEVGFTPRRRGLIPVPRILVETRYPLGLFRAWSYLWLKTPVLVYPRPVEPPGPTQNGYSDLEGGHSSATHYPSDELLLRPFRTGDPLQRVQWKRYAKDGQMVVSERESTSIDSRWLDYDDYPGADQELRLSYLTWLIEEAHNRGQVFGLRLPGSLLLPDASASHRREALRRLALFGDAR